ncbi:hypothetical protein F4801DRAFT_530213 [Xylaria longipes]|nr:hypothetical protein F4801DRAFT_530213 [Xylaria longipes]
MSETQGLAMPDAPYTYCYCENKAPYLFIAPLDNEGHPDWSSAHTGRVAICWELKCDFLKPWPRNENGPSPSGEIREWEDQYRECRSAQQSVSRNMQKSQYDRVKVVGADNAVGDTFVGSCLQGNNIISPLFKNKFHFRTVLNKKADAGRHAQGNRRSLRRFRNMGGRNRR